ncbi:hypothetical protein HPP92_002903 [Vanilla planifolia]|uniref:Uncharacterized protein n=1 Tax=Vanilla planifolia TaxID=51239 RepID=A0A835S785_VANPL|nr:hypothetical protein HPP92_002903 [Vanilla planifolia]
MTRARPAPDPRRPMPHRGADRADPHVTHDQVTRRLHATTQNAKFRYPRCITTVDYHPHCDSYESGLKADPRHHMSNATT